MLGCHIIKLAVYSVCGYTICLSERNLISSFENPLFQRCFIFLETLKGFLLLISIFNHLNIIYTSCLKNSTVFWQQDQNGPV